MAIVQHQKEEQEKAEKQRIKQDKINKRWNTFETICHIIGNMLKWTCIILFSGIYLIFKFMSDLAKGR